MKKLISILLSFLLLMSVTGITYGRHYCGDTMMKDAVMIGVENLSCGMFESTLEDCNEKPQVKESKPCCSNSFHQIQTDDDYSGSHFNFSLGHNIVFTQVPVQTLQPPVLYFHNPFPFSEYLPPPLLKDIPVLFQTFII